MEIIDKNLEKMHTKQLLKELRSYYWQCDYSSKEEEENEKKRISEIKSILATREHVPNKIESRNARILKKKQGN